MSRAALPTITMVQKHFKQCLKDALELGIMPPSDCGFHTDTVMALRKLAQAYPNADASLVQRARSAFADQLAARG